MHHVIINHEFKLVYVALYLYGFVWTRSEENLFMRDNLDDLIDWLPMRGIEHTQL